MCQESAAKPTPSRDCKHPRLPLDTGFDELLLGKISEPCYNFTQLKNPLSLFSCRDLFSLLDGDLVQPATYRRKSREAFSWQHETTAPFSGLLWLHTQCLWRVHPYSFPSFLSSLYSLTTDWQKFPNLSIVLFSSLRTAQGVFQVSKLI